MPVAPDSRAPGPGAAEAKAQVVAAFAPPQRLAPGDRVPNAVLLDPWGRPVPLYGLFPQGPCLLLAVGPEGPQGAPGAPAQAQGLVGVLAGPPERAAALAQAAGLGWPLLAEPEGRLHAQLGPAGSALLLDGNQRVLQRCKSADEGLAALAHVRAQAPLAGRPAQPPPVLLIPDVLDAGQCAALIDLWRTGQEEGAVGTTGVDGRSLNRAKETRRCRDHTILDPDLNRAIGQAIARRIAPEVAKAFAFRLSNAENYYVVGYEAARGDFFRPHRDNANPAFAHRRFAMTLSLNAGAYTGGGVRFPEYDPTPVDPPKGGAVVFSCSLLHEAVEVEAGTRFILSNFFWGPAEERQRLAYRERVGRPG